MTGDHSAQTSSRPSSLEPRICEAIRTLSVLEFEYEGRLRVVHPYCHGFTSTGLETLRAIQVEGESRTGGFGYGKLWTVAKMSHLRTTIGRRFQPEDPDYNPDDSAMAEIHCRVKR
jgi:hypothetical protein